MNYVDLQRVTGICERVKVTPNYQDADTAYRNAIDTADDTVSNVSWYFNLGNDQQHIGSRTFRAITETNYNTAIKPLVTISNH